MDQISVVQNVQFIILWVLLIAVAYQLINLYVKLSVKKKVYGAGKKGLEKYIETEIVKEEMQINKARGASETK